MPDNDDKNIDLVFRKISIIRDPRVSSKLFLLNFLIYLHCKSDLTSYVKRCALESCKIFLSMRRCLLSRQPILARKRFRVPAQRGQRQIRPTALEVGFTAPLRTFAHEKICYVEN